MQWLRTASIDDIIKSLPPEYYQADEKLYRKSLEKNLSAFQWDGIVSERGGARASGTRSRSSSRSCKAAKVDFDRTYDNRLDRAGAREIQGAAQGVTRFVNFATVFQLRAVPRVPSFFSISEPVSFERPIPSG